MRPRGDNPDLHIGIIIVARETTDITVHVTFHKRSHVFPRPSFSVVLKTDASERGWCTHLDDQFIARTWSTTERLHHINRLELLAVSKAVQTLESQVSHQLILVKTDNSTVVSYINRQGGTHSPSLCLATWELLTRCIQRGISLQAIHLGGKKNVSADALSRG